MRGSENGESRVGTIFWLALIAAGLFAAFNVGPAYLANYSLDDKIAEIARMPKGIANDDKIYDLLLKYVREEQLYSYINRDNFRVSTMEGHRTISVSYYRTVTILPGFTKTVQFAFKTDQLLPY